MLWFGGQIRGVLLQLRAMAPARSASFKKPSLHLRVDDQQLALPLAIL